MSAVDDIVANLPLDQLAQQLGTDPDTAAEAAELALPALLGGLNANAADPSGAASLAEAVQQHDNGLADGPIDLAAVDTADGQRIASHIFGGNQEQVVSQLGGVGGGSSALVQKIIPILAPIVLSYLASQLGKKGGAGGAAAGAAGGGMLGQVLSEVLTGASQGTTRRSGASMGSIVTDVLGGLLGGGRK